MFSAKMILTIFFWLANFTLSVSLNCQFVMNMSSCAAECVTGTTDVQCLHRWQKVLDPNLVKGPWTKEVEIKFIGCLLKRVYFLFEYFIMNFFLLGIPRKMILSLSWLGNKVTRSGLK